jgi:TP901 family phage tail tape measure protein
MAKTIYEILIQLEGDKAAKSAIQDLGKASGLAGAALTTFSVGVSKLALDYEQALQNIATVSDETTGTTEEFSAALFNLQSELGGAINVQEAAAASYDVLSAGIKDQASVLATLETAQKVAIAGQGDLTSSNKALISIVNAYGDALGENLTQVERIEKAGNLLIQTQLDGVITGQQYAQSIGQVAASAAGAGVSIEEVNAAIAASTAGGTQASQAFTRLQALISNIQKPTADAADEAERLGIQFNAARLQSVGLEGVLNDITSAANFNDESLVKLFGSVEALGIATQLAKTNNEQFTNSLRNQGQAASALEDTFNTVSEARAQQIQNSLNLLQGSLIQLGQGALIAFTPAIEALGKLAQLLSETDPRILQVVGTLSAITGVALTVNGAILLLASSFGSLVATATTFTTFTTATLIPALVKTAAAMKSSALATSLLNKGLIALAGKAAVAAAPVVALAAALELLRRDLRNRRIEEFNQDIQQAQQETEILAQKASTLGIKIRESGQAIPDDEFEKWIALLEDASGEHDVLRPQIEALKKVQAEAKQSAEDQGQAQMAAGQASSDLADETKELTSTTDEAAQKASEAAQKWQDYQSSIRSAIGNIQSSTNNQIGSIIGDGPEQIQARLQAAEDGTNKQVALLQDLANQSQTTARERETIEIEIQGKLVQLNRQRIETVQQLEKIALDNTLANIELATQGQVQALQNLANNSTISQQALGIQNDALNGQADILGRIQSALENQNTSFEARGQLLQFVGQLQQQGLVNINGQITAESALTGIQQQLAQIEAQKLDLKVRQLQIEKEQLAVVNQIKQLEISGQRQAIQTQLGQDDLTPQERQRLTQQDQALASQAQLSNQQTQLQGQSLDNQIELATIESQLNQILANAEEGLSPADIEKQAEATAKGIEKAKPATKEATKEGTSEALKETEIPGANSSEQRVIGGPAASRITGNTSFTPGSIGGTQTKLLEEVVAIRKLLANLNINPGNQNFNIVNDSNPLTTIRQIQQARFENVGQV